MLGVLEGVLASQPGKDKWLVGDRITFADLAFVPWNNYLHVLLLAAPDQVFAGFPHVRAWHESMASRASWIKAMEVRTRCMDEQGLDENGMPKGTTDFQEYQTRIAAESEAEGV